MFRARSVATAVHRPWRRWFASAPQFSTSKGSLLTEVKNIINEDVVFNADVVESEAEYFFHDLGINEVYFRTFPAEQIAAHLHSFIAAKKMAMFSEGEMEAIDMSIEQENTAVYICSASFENKQLTEEKLADYIIRSCKPTDGYSISYYLSSAPCLPGGTVHLCIYHVVLSPFMNPDPPADAEDLSIVATESFLQKAPSVRARYQDLVHAAAQSFVPVVRSYETDPKGTTAVVFAFSGGSDVSNFPQLGAMLHKSGIVADRKFVEFFSNGVVCYTVYIHGSPSARIQQFIDHAVMLSQLDWQNSFMPLFTKGNFNAKQLAYCQSACYYAFYFMGFGAHLDVWSDLTDVFKKDNVNLGRLNRLRHRLRHEAISEARVSQAVVQNAQVVSCLYDDFIDHIEGRKEVGVLDPDLVLLVEKKVASARDQRILRSFLQFNSSVVKTNFNKKGNSAVGYRLDPAVVLQATDLEVPFGMFLIHGFNFRAFHLRFRDVSRGGVRIIRSPTLQQYQQNIPTLFDEVYGLASTQQMKNKDIPEGGSKGIILPAMGQEKREASFFMKYVDALLDLITPDSTNAIDDRYHKPEILFLGPDENTADLMTPACKHARQRGYPYWKAFTTGKTLDMGGIPHDKYGMTTTSVRAYVDGIVEKEGLDIREVTKLQTGGPDGDLGSNEILMSQEKTVGIVDGSGVIYDPRGLHRDELVRLAKSRKTVSEFNASLLSDTGFKVLVGDDNVRLPNGFLVPRGVTFRNQFCINPIVEADFLVPCGGRPETINIQNVDHLIGKNGALKYKYVVEGANLFVTEDARIALDAAGVILYKDSSTNKGGVTSSSLEVLVALAMTDGEFQEYFAQRPDGTHPDFYEQYVQQVKAIITRNARAEFAVLWDTHAQLEGTVPRSILSTQLSTKINELNDYVQASAMWENRAITERVLRRAIPPLLVNLVGMDNIFKRVPEPYLKAMFGAYLSSDYIYTYGLDADEFKFFQHMDQFED